MTSKKKVDFTVNIPRKKTTVLAEVNCCTDDGVPYRKFEIQELVPNNDVRDDDFSLSTIMHAGSLGLLDKINPITDSSAAGVDKVCEAFEAIENETVNFNK